MGLKFSRLDLILYLLVAPALALGLTFFGLTFIGNIPPGTGDNVKVFVPPKSSLPQIARLLGDEGVLSSPWKFRLLTRVLKKHRELKPGEYYFELPTPPLRAMRILVEGKSLLHKVTFPEGVTLKDMSKILEDSKLIQEGESFDEVISDKEFQKSLNVPGPSFEGFLFPDTYRFSKLDGARKIVKTMHRHLVKALRPEDQEKAKALKLSLLDWVTLASIIEKESTWADEQPIISSVFHNRLKKGMRLQTDPTVIYGIENFDGNLTRKHLTTPTPYNTYTNKGLPPGPIANPGATAIQAAVNPAQTDFFFFVADRKGRHVFSKTYEEHNRNVAYYQLRRRRR